MLFNGWSKNFRINNVDANGRGFHGILIRDHVEIYTVWVAGSPGSMGINFKKVIATSQDSKPVTATYSESGKYVQFNCSVDCAMVYIGRY